MLRSEERDVCVCARVHACFCDAGTQVNSEAATDQTILYSTVLNCNLLNCVI